MDRLTGILKRIDGRGYGAYKEIKGAYRGNGFEVIVDHVQGDPFAAPSRVRVRVAARDAGFPPDFWHALWDHPVKNRAVCDFLTRAVARSIRGIGRRGGMGSGKSGEIAICLPTQQVLARNSVLLSREAVECRLTVGLPARGRTVLGRQAAAMFAEMLPVIVMQSLVYANLDADAVRHHVQTVEDQDHLRRWVVENGHAGFVADGSLLPRRSGVDEHPLADGLPFAAPASLSATVGLPHAGEVTGMVIPKGVTVIVGGGFHGKSTLLSALETGVYDHVPGDGRERVAADPTAVKVRAEDGRAVTDVDISPFIGNLPMGRDTTSFSTGNASGSTSQAAGIVEALAAGCTLLLIDEDTSATNFMIRDARMQKLVAGEKEPITPLLFRVRELFEKHGVSSVVVMGGSGDWFEVADTVILMDSYVPQDVTGTARKLADPPQVTALTDAVPIRLDERGRVLPPLSARRGRREVKIDSRGREEIGYGSHRIDISRVAQIADPAQARAIGWLLHLYAEKYAPKYAQKYVEAGPVAGLKRALADAEEYGLDVLTDWPVGNLALPRIFELAAALNRVRHSR